MWVKIRIPPILVVNPYTHGPRQLFTLKYNLYLLVTFHWPELNHVSTIDGKGSWEIYSLFYVLCMAAAKIGLSIPVEEEEVGGGGP